VIYGENPIASQWKTLGGMRREVKSIGEYVQTEVRYATPSFNKAKGTIEGGPYFRIRERKAGVPWAYMSAGSEKEQKPPRPIPKHKSSIFTWTIKMSCPSFSVSAGPGEYEGQCPASVEKHTVGLFDGAREFGTQTHRADKGQTYICDICYAGKNNYLRYRSTVVSQVSRYYWTVNALKTGQFADLLTEGIEMLFNPKVEQVLRMKLVSNKYFRIHDAADFWTEQYFVEWLRICHRFRNRVMFWAPTRMWVFPKWREVFKRNIPSNLALRPSALFVGAPPPVIPGMAAGTTSVDGDIPATLNCPAYESEEGDKSCVQARCRTCWTRPNEAVNYKTH
jgi:hypothetical protein